MSVQPHVSLIDLSKQLKFDIDEETKKKISFNETLVVSCAHCEDTFESEASESESSCTDSTESKLFEGKKDEEVVVKHHIEESLKEEVKNEKDVEENDFYFYFFPECNKPIPANIKTNIIMKDGFPTMNKIKSVSDCTCEIDKTGKCPCYLKVPCKCGQKKKDECICSEAENICICGEIPELICKCKQKNVCLCHPDGKLQQICTCGEVQKPCICQRDKFPYPICVCEHKPEFREQIDKISSKEIMNDETEEKLKLGTTSDNLKEPCICQKSSPSPICQCIKGKDCICKKGTCICSVQPTCTCDPMDDAKCGDNDSKTQCSCFLSSECKCYNDLPNDCSCFPEPKYCTCGDAEKCVCFTSCKCEDPCLCDIMTVKKENICVCDSQSTISCGSNDVKKLKRVRAQKHGYRWCHDVDPKHTYFDYAYNRHNKISYKEQTKEKLKILGLYEERKTVDVGKSETVSDKIPIYKKKVRRPSIGCCSAVGGISISVETLGEDKDKFLVQVVSNASKEGAKTGSKLVSIVDCNLHTLEENRIEHITKRDLTKEQRSYMTICESGYYNKVTRICGERHFVKRLYHSFEAARNFLLEGANVVLLRYFGISRFCGHVKTDTVLINGIICESVYVCMGVSQAIVNGKPLFVSKVERHIIEPSGFIHQTLTVLTLRGYLVSHEWADSSYIFHINPLLRVVPERDEIEPHEPLREKWRTDLQLLSDYLDFKSTRSSEGARYVTENGELAGVIRDYLQTLLLLRPQDALHFTRHYFSSALSALDLPHNEYFDPCSKHVRYYFFED